MREDGIEGKLGGRRCRNKRKKEEGRDNMREVGMGGLDRQQQG